MTPSTPYELVAPSRWAQPPKQFSFSSPQAVAACPRRWQLLHSEWGTFSRFPERANPSAVEGQFGRLIFGFAVTEALGIFALLIAFLLLFAV